MSADSSHVQRTVPCGDCGEPGQWRAGYGWCGVRMCPDNYAALCDGCKGRIDLREGTA